MCMLFNFITIQAIEFQCKKDSDCDGPGEGKKTNYEVKLGYYFKAN